MGAAPLTGFTTATVLALPAVVVPIVLVVAAIGSGFGGSGESTVEGGAAFRGAETLWRTVGWTASIGALAALAGWAPGRRLAAGGARWLAFAAVLPLMLPGWLLFHGFWTAIGPGTFVGDLASRLDQVRLLRELALGAGLLAACWPLAAWSVAIERRGRECSSAALEAIDGLPWARRIAIAFREDRAALLRGAVMAMLLLWSTTVAFDLAGVRTFGFELRTLDAEGASTATILALGWPGLLPGIALLAIVTSLPSPREDATTESAPGGRWRIALWSTVVLVGVPILLMAWGVLRDSGLDPEALRAFAILHGPSVLPTLAVAGSTAALAGILAAALVVALGAGAGTSFEPAPDRSRDRSAGLDRGRGNALGSAGGRGHRSLESSGRGLGASVAGDSGSRPAWSIRRRGGGDRVVAVSSSSIRRERPLGDRRPAASRRGVGDRAIPSPRSGARHLRGGLLALAWRSRAFEPAGTAR